MRVFSTPAGVLLERNGVVHAPAQPLSLDTLFQSADPAALVHAALVDARTAPLNAITSALLAPLQSQEVWAAGVTYFRSRTARMEESKVAGGGSFYDRVYEADRPELFFKATPHRVAAPGTPVRIRADSKWNVPEPELTLAINSAGKIFGYTIGNDMSSRDIEGENPLYLPQAKVYDRSAALGPCIVITDTLPAATTVIAIEIRRAGKSVFAGETTVGQIKRPLPSLAAWLFRDNSFPHGCFLMTGTGVVPPDAFTLQAGDEVRITIEPVGTLVNTVQ
ncbi:fumarylacetoacetate hydrolase family protein [Horticoccus sp. 23ND18S-11]|uniref:fumarylacetoacetate hydrolase family protein n=1 Tax=Horticoccus sp. 23ND18S-11 TaxID=3391832 RepID=UPI0039C99A2A